MNKRILLIMLVLSLGIFYGCGNDPDPASDAPDFSLSTTLVTDLTAISASSGGTILSDAGSPITARGVVWNTAEHPDISLSTKTTNGTGTGTFSSTLINLSPGTTYFVRAYATNAQGTGYGNEVTFVTPAANLPVVTTAAVTAIGATGATSGGNAQSDGGSAIVSRGVCWSTSPNPTVALSTKVVNGGGTGIFESTVAGLTDGTRYYLRAYATNANGTAYGNEFVFQAMGAFTSLDNALAAKMSKFSVPGMSIAILRNEKLVYVKSYGLADKEAQQVATNDNLYRIASVSKPLTAVAILKLEQEGKLSVSNTVFGANGILGNDFGAPPAGSNKELITIQHLLDHTSGWVNVPDDPMFSDNARTRTDIIKDLVANRALANPVGTKYYYLNFGYCVLGRVIEKVTGMAYDQYMQTLFAPMGITTMTLAGNTLAERKPNEVKYYQSEYSPYAMNVNRMDSHGGWLATATDLARFLVRIDRNGQVADVVSTAELNKLYFSEASWVHSGSLPGTSTLFGRINDTFSFVLLSNTRTNNNADQILSELYNVMINEVPARADWPAYDLF
ncbi:serine hydrolase domain-containing protein [Chryseolinea lacunae]|uniref:Beta-lactamase family protein n=1 Tax=Chryseolinea lacunae TaxID=2801331 RepID=A0ABS1L1L1_9BACT|nr:serine hydrolase domain-containing protein [Chryseolinea lacunae]MBL0745571.1 beta-lactamase family protein [Chryseolinea lacunae]